MSRTEDLWVEMSIREIATQCHFAKIAYNNIEIKSAKPTDQAFTSIHSFLSHAANVSKMLKSSGELVSIGEILGISDGSVIHMRTFRNQLEHYDERLKVWISQIPEGTRIGTYNIGPTSHINRQNILLVSHYDPQTKIFTFVDNDIDLEVLQNEVKRISRIADKWVVNFENLTIFPPLT